MCSGASKLADQLQKLLLWNYNCFLRWDHPIGRLSDILCQSFLSNTQSHPTKQCNTIDLMCRWRLEGGKKCNEHSLRAGFSEELLTCSPLNVLYGKEYHEPLQSKIKRPSKTKGFHGEHASHLFYLKSISFRGPGRRHNHPNSNNFSYLFFSIFFFRLTLNSGSTI